MGESQFIKDLIFNLKNVLDHQLLFHFYYLIVTF